MGYAVLQVMLGSRNMERMPMPRQRDDHTHRLLRLLRDGGIALVGVAALAGLARDLSATRGPVVAWIIVALLGGAAGLFAWSLLEIRDPRYHSSPSDTTCAQRDARPAGDLDPRTLVPLVPSGLFPAARPATGAPRVTRRRTLAPRAQVPPRGVRMRTRRTSAACAAGPARRPIARAGRRPPSTTA